MGFNAGLAGFRDVEDMVSQMMRGENEQILAMASFMRASGMHVPLQSLDWTAFARRYNGPAFANNRYHEKLAAAHTSLTGRGLPNLETRALQLLLTYHGFNLGKVDGIEGERTRAAITAFRTKHRLPASRDHKDLRATLLEMLPPAADDQSVRISATPAPARATPDLRLVQSLLEYLDWSPGRVDGRPGPRTRSAIAGFQRSRGAAATGEADVGLLTALAAEAKQRFGRNRIADARVVQRLLAIRGFDPGKIDGRVGPGTRAAISAFVLAQRGSPTKAVDAGLLGALLASDGNASEPGTGA
jgi:peptidoglycan hydrolase-like protein with peptidoglycan-binding domain